METVVLVAVVSLCVVFAGAMLLLVLICVHKNCKRLDLLSQQHLQASSPDMVLVQHMEGEEGGVELDHVSGEGRSLEQVLDDHDWVSDATGLAPHCLAILRTCHVLSERLVAMTMRGNHRELCSPETISDLAATAKRINPRVDDVVRALYPPLDPRLLEARCTALVLSVSHLVLITKNACCLSGVLDWIDQSLADVDDHLRASGGGLYMDGQVTRLCHPSDYPNHSLHYKSEGKVLREASIAYDDAEAQHAHAQRTGSPLSRAGDSRRSSRRAPISAAVNFQNRLPNQNIPLDLNAANENGFPLVNQLPVSMISTANQSMPHQCGGTNQNADNSYASTNQRAAQCSPRTWVSAPQPTATVQVRTPPQTRPPEPARDHPVIPAPLSPREQIVI